MYKQTVPHVRDAYNACYTKTKHFVYIPNLALCSVCGCWRNYGWRYKNSMIWSKPT